MPENLVPHLSTCSFPTQSLRPCQGGILRPWEAFLPRGIWATTVICPSSAFHPQLTDETGPPTCCSSGDSSEAFAEGGLHMGAWLGSAVGRFPK